MSSALEVTGKVSLAYFHFQFGALPKRYYAHLVTS